METEQNIVKVVKAARYLAQVGGTSAIKSLDALLNEMSIEDSRRAMKLLFNAKESQETMASRRVDGEALAFLCSAANRVFERKEERGFQ